MGNIVLLDDLTINKIAAGEVIERPASVVKEVVENSIDAGADNISIEIRNGGISYIRITDNGKGIQADDLEIAFERHATSKIRRAEDLENVKSMGFRGEALASIAAIARVELVSKTEDSDIGHKIVVEGGRIISKEEVGCPKGTSITIENLFFNTPVRYKFLKKDFTESGYIEDAITRIALVNPNIAFKLINTGKTIIQTSGNGEIKDVVYAIYGKDIAENIVNVEYTFEDMSVKGVIGKPSIARSNRANQLFFVNKRFVKDKTLTSAAEQAFKGMLTVGKYGFLILNIDIDPHKLDVNVHPAKLEVRFEEENKVFKLVYHAIKETLLKGNILGQNESQAQAFAKRNYIDQLEKIDNKTTESKGFGSFLKNIINRNEQEFVEENNLVEQLYNDKLKQEKDDILGTINKNQSYDNMVVKEDGGIELKNLESEHISIEEAMAKYKAIENGTFEHDSNESSINLNGDSNQNTSLNINATNTLSEEETEKIKNDLISRILDNNIKTDDLIADISANMLGKTDVSNGFNNSEDIQNNEKQENVDVIESNEVSNPENLDKLENSENSVSDNSNETSDIISSEQSDIDINEKVEQILDNKQDAESSEVSDVSFEEMYEKMFGTSVIKPKVEEVKEGYTLDDEELKSAENISLFNDKNLFSGPVYKYIGIAFDTYIIIEYEKEMYIIDQHAAHERILYEKVKKNYYSDEDKDSQLMLLPDIINLTHREMGIAKDNMELFRKAGFDLEEFGENTIKLNGVPNICIDLDTRELFLETLDEINTVARTAKQEIEEKFIATVACKAAVKANMALTEAEVDNLMQKLLVLPNPFTCPHGRPTAIRMSKIDIEKKFSRR